MSNSQPPGYGYPTDPPHPYGQQQPGYGQVPPQQPYGQSGYPQQPPPPPYGGQVPPQPYGQPQPPQQQLPPWLVPPSPYGPPAPGTVALASSADRFLARLIDSAVLLIPGLLLYAIIGSVSGFLYYIAVGLIGFGYEAAMLLTQGGQTVGKKAMKIRVVSLAHGGRPAESELWMRAAVYSGPQAVYCLGDLFLLLNVLWHLWDKPLQQCLHDKAGKTVVVKVG